jgi:hypothetical protein
VNKKLVLSVLSTAVVASMAASAMAKPDAGFYVGGQVDKYYNIDAFFNHFDEALDEIVDNLDSTTYVDADGNAASFQDILTANGDLSKVMKPASLDHFEKNPYAIVDGEGTWNPENDPDLLPVDSGELKVESVTALNAKDIVVDFDDELDEVTAGSAKNYEIKVNNGAALADTDYTVSVDEDDASKVTIVLNTPLKTGDFVSVKVKKGVLNKDLGGLTEDVTKTFTYTDTTAPAVDSVEVDGADLVINFSEYVSAIGLIKIDGVNFAAAPTLPAKSVTLTGAVSGLAVGEHTITLANVKDLEPTPNNAAIITKKFNVVEDVTAPEVSSVTPVAANQFKLVFSKEVTAPTVAVTKGGFALNVAVAPGANAKEYIVTVSDNGGVKLYNTGESVANLAVNVSGYKAISNNLVGDAFTSNVTLTKDTVAPAVDSRYSKIALDAATSTNEVFQVRFNEVIATPDISKVVLKDKNGVKKTVSAVNIVADAKGQNTILEIDSAAVRTGTTINAGTYTIELGANAVVDTAGNGNTATSVTLTKEAASVPDMDLNGKITASGDTITIVFPENMTTAALDASNYKIDGQDLPEGTQIYFDPDVTTVVIKLPAGSIENTADVLFSISSDLKSEAGAKVEADDLDTVLSGLKDNVQPVLVSAKKVDSTHVELTFSESIDTIVSGPTYIDDFEVTVNGATLAVTAVDNHSTDNKKVVLTVDPYNTAQAVKVVTADSDLNTADLEGNVIVGGKEVVAN